jgi:hypothetical protein
VIGVVNYVIAASPSLLNFMIADSEEAVLVDADSRGTWVARIVVTKRLLLDAGV